MPLAISNLPIAYCANVHPGATWDQANANIIRFAGGVARRLARPIGVGGWLPAAACRDLLTHPGQIDAFRAWLQGAKIVVYTMNAFPFGDFHAKRVKDDVYRPDWTTAERADYTCRVADLLSRLMPESAEASISTLPLAFAPHHPRDKDTSIYLPKLLDVARYLRRLADDSGKVIRLAIEPEPGCVLETTQQAIDFFQSLWNSADPTPDGRAVREHVGLCYDVCHQAVEYENIADSIDLLRREGVRINKVQLSCALELCDPRDDVARRELAAFAEERYLHQTFARHPSGRIRKRMDLASDHARNPPADWLDCESWRVHFHVPVHRTTMGRLATTRPQLEEAVRCVRNLDYQPHLEVETYTWGVLPTSGPGEYDFDLADGIAKELASVLALTEPPPSSEI